MVLVPSAPEALNVRRKGSTIACGYGCLHPLCRMGMMVCPGLPSQDARHLQPEAMCIRYRRGDFLQPEELAADERQQPRLLLPQRCRHQRYHSWYHQRHRLLHRHRPTLPAMAYQRTHPLPVLQHQPMLHRMLLLQQRRCTRPQTWDWSTLCQHQYHQQTRTSNDRRTLQPYGCPMSKVQRIIHPHAKVSVMLLMVWRTSLVYQTHISTASSSFLPSKPRPQPGDRRTGSPQQQLGNYDADCAKVGQSRGTSHPRHTAATRHGQSRKPPVRRTSTRTWTVLTFCCFPRSLLGSRNRQTSMAWNTWGLWSSTGTILCRRCSELSRTRRQPRRPIISTRIAGRGQFCTIRSSARTCQTSSIFYAGTVATLNTYTRRLQTSPLHMRCALLPQRLRPKRPRRHLYSDKCCTDLASRRRTFLSTDSTKIHRYINAYHNLNTVLPPDAKFLPSMLCIPYSLLVATNKQHAPRTAGSADDGGCIWQWTGRASAKPPYATKPAQCESQVIPMDSDARAKQGHEQATHRHRCSLQPQAKLQYHRTHKSSRGTTTTTSRPYAHAAQRPTHCLLGMSRALSTYILSLCFISRHSAPYTPIHTQEAYAIHFRQLFRVEPQLHNEHAEYYPPAQHERSCERTHAATDVWGGCRSNGCPAAHHCKGGASGTCGTSAPCQQPNATIIGDAAECRNARQRYPAETEGAATPQAQLPLVYAHLPTQRNINRPTWAAHSHSLHQMWRRLGAYLRGQRRPVHVSRYYHCLQCRSTDGTFHVPNRRNHWQTAPCSPAAEQWGKGQPLLTGHGGRRWRGPATTSNVQEEIWHALPLPREALQLQWRQRMLQDAPKSTEATPHVDAPQPRNRGSQCNLTIIRARLRLRFDYPWRGHIQVPASAAGPDSDFCSAKPIMRSCPKGNSSSSYTRSNRQRFRLRHALPATKAQCFALHSNVGLDTDTRHVVSLIVRGPKRNNYVPKYIITHCNLSHTSPHSIHIYQSSITAQSQLDTSQCPPLSNVVASAKQLALTLHNVALNADAHNVSAGSQRIYCYAQPYDRSSKMISDGHGWRMSSKNRRPIPLAAQQWFLPTSITTWHRSEHCYGYGQHASPTTTMATRATALVIRGLSLTKHCTPLLYYAHHVHISTYHVLRRAQTINNQTGIPYSFWLAQEPLLHSQLPGTRFRPRHTSNGFQLYPYCASTVHTPSRRPTCGGIGRPKWLPHYHTMWKMQSRPRQAIPKCNRRGDIGHNDTLCIRITCHGQGLAAETKGIPAINGRHHGRFRLAPMVPGSQCDDQGKRQGQEQAQCRASHNIPIPLTSAWRCHEHTGNLTLPHVIRGIANLGNKHDGDGRTSGSIRSQSANPGSTNRRSVGYECARRDPRCAAVSLRITGEQEMVTTINIKLCALNSNISLYNALHYAKPLQRFHVVTYALFWPNSLNTPGIAAYTHRVHLYQRPTRSASHVPNCADDQLPVHLSGIIGYGAHFLVDQLSTLWTLHFADDSDSSKPWRFGCYLSSTPHSNRTMEALQRNMRSMRSYHSQGPDVTALPAQLGQSQGSIFDGHSAAAKAVAALTTQGKASSLSAAPFPPGLTVHRRADAPPSYVEGTAISKHSVPLHAPRIGSTLPPASSHSPKAGLPHGTQRRSRSPHSHAMPKRYHGSITLSLSHSDSVVPPAHAPPALHPMIDESTEPAGAYVILYISSQNADESARTRPLPAPHPDDVTDLDGDFIMISPSSTHNEANATQTAITANSSASSSSATTYVNTDAPTPTPPTTSTAIQTRMALMVATSIPVPDTDNATTATAPSTAGQL